MQDFLYINNLTFTYSNAAEPLFDSISLQLSQGWTGVVGANGSGKTTLLKLLCRILDTDTGSIRFSGNAYYCEQRTDYIPQQFENLIQSTEKSAYKIKHRLEIQENWMDNWEKLSYGERKRCQIATALFLNPLVLAIDEPSNHLDLQSKKILYNALKRFRGIGVLVSHDRELLDNLCQMTLILNNNGIDLRRCNYSTAIQEIEKEKMTRKHDYEIAAKEVKKLKRQVRKQKEKANQADKKRSKRGVGAKDHDAKSKIDAARLSGKDATAGKIYKHLQNQLDRKQQQKSKIGFDKKRTLGITFIDQKAQGRFPVSITPDKLSLNENKLLVIPDLLIQAGEKIGIVGNNGSGKSSFINYLIKRLQFQPDQIIYIPQEIPIDQTRIIINRIHNFDKNKKGKMMTLISRLGSEPTHVLETTIPSPGEIRKLLLAEGIMKNPALIIMDEPTNHMDLPSIQCVEQALNDCGCSQLLVSHDLEFLKNIVEYYWSFEKDGEVDYKIWVRGQVEI